MDHRNRNALVTGASSGIGEVFSRELAARGSNLLLTALPAEQERLSEIQEELRQRHGVRVEVVTVDLSERDSPQELQAKADALGFEPDLLVNSAGIGGGGIFAEGPLGRDLKMIQVNAEALVALCGLYVPRMVARGDGGIINIASTSAFDPAPYMAVYAASKAFVLRFSEALWAETHKAGVRVVTVCPGPVATAFHQAAGDSGSATGVRKEVQNRYLAPESVVQASLDGLERDRPTVVKRLPAMAAIYYTVAVLGKLLSRRNQLVVSERLNRWLFQQQS